MNVQRMLRLARGAFPPLVWLEAWIAEGRTVLLTDHEMAIMMELCQQIYVLDHGEVIAHGTPAEVRADERVMEAYFGR